MINVTCIIPSLCSEKSYPIIKRCVNSLRKSEKKSKRIKLKVLVISNGERVVLKDIRNKIDFLIKFKDKYSYSKMNNVAIEFALKQKPDWVLLLNDDAFVDSDFFSEFNKTRQLKPTCEIISPLIYENGTKLIDSYGVEYFNSGYAKNNPILSNRSQLAAAACLMVRRKLLEDLKKKYGFYFNEILTSYMEDVDLALRIRGLGKEIVKSKLMIVSHMVSFTNKRRSRYVMYQTYRNIIWLIIMDWPIKNIIKNIHNIVLVQLWVVIFSIFTKGPFLYIRLWIDTFKNIPKLIRLRKIILRAYSNKFNFNKILSVYAFRTRQGYKIRLP